MWIWIKQEKWMLLTWLLLSTLFTLVHFTEMPDEQGFVEESNIFELLFNIFHIFYLLLCIRYIRGKLKTSKKSPNHEKEIGIWGYSWRSILAFVVYIIPVSIPNLAFGLHFYDNGYWIKHIIMAAFLTPVVISILYGKNRAYLAKKAYLYINGIKT